MKTWENEHELVKILQEEMPKPHLDTDIKNSMYHELVSKEHKIYNRQKQLKWITRGAFACVFALMFSFFAITNQVQQLIGKMASPSEPNQNQENLLGTIDRHGESINEGYLKIKTTIGQLHKDIDLIVDDNETQIDNINWKQWDSQSINFEKQVEELIMIPTLEPMHMDLINLMDCILISSEQHNPQAMRYVHRIIHDLDYHWFNDYSNNEKPYGVTHIVTGSMKVEHFIRQQDYKSFMERQLERDKEIQQNR